MGIKLKKPNKSGGTTDHSREIRKLRNHAEKIMDRYNDPHDCPKEQNYEIYICMTAAALLEVHDDSGISLDRWIGPRQLCELAMTIIGGKCDDFIENGI